MADTARPDVRSTTTSIIGSPGVVSSGMFSGAQNFMLTGHTFQNITYAAPTEPADYRTFALGDIDLQREICLDNDTGVVSRRQREGGRRLYSAKVNGQTFTVALYQGDGATEKWRKEIGTYMSLRHPNIIQIYGAASSSGIHATIFHGDLIPFEQWLDPYKSFPCVIVFLYAYYTREFDDADKYFGKLGIFMFSSRCTMWIRRSTGRLCVDLMVPCEPIYLNLDNHASLTISDSEATPFVSGDTHIIEALAIDALTLELYHEVCYRTLFRSCTFDFPDGVTIYPGMVISRPSKTDFVEIASLMEEETASSGWFNLGLVAGEIMENGWTWFNTRDVVGGALGLPCFTGMQGNMAWLSQSNHIFKRCQIRSNFEDYVLVNTIDFRVEISAAAEEIPMGFLFLCPAGVFRAGPSSWRWATCPAYWSLEPSGAHPLSREEAMELGFPTLHFRAEVWGRSWDSSVYAGLAKFHQAKGFDPYSQDVARHLGYTLYQPSVPVDPVFAHVVEEEDLEEQDDLDSQMDVDPDDAENQDDEDLSDMEVDY
ncbi:hypothetical protein DFH06DRAFT_1372259 [Mycena polygramma]|nr:hypothetical protein DFH06DRAFT_1372259 [Mycena polygramma]